MKITNSCDISTSQLVANHFIQGHGSLNDIYETVDRKATEKGWDSVDLVIIGGDFQVSTLSCPIPHELNIDQLKPGSTQCQ